MDICPCKNCDKRKIGCHGECQLYLSWSKQKQEENARIHEQERMASWAHPDKPVRRRR